MDSVIATLSGLKFDYLNPKASQVCLADIAAGVSKMPRYVGQTKTSFTVAQHAIIGSYLIEPSLALTFMHHDDAEAYTGDIPTPLKRQLFVHCYNRYGEKETRLDIYERNKLLPCIWKALKLPKDSFLDPAVKQMDALMLEAERRILKPRIDWWPWNRDFDGELLDRAMQMVREMCSTDSSQWERIYLNRHKELS